MAEAPGPELTDDLALEMANVAREAELAQAAQAMAQQPGPAEQQRRQTARRPDLGRYVLNSATFGAADPVIAALASGPSYLVGRLTGSKEGLGDVYSRVREDLRAGERATEEAYGWGAPAAGIIGGMAMGPGVVKMAGQGANLVGRGLEAVGAGLLPRLTGQAAQRVGNAVQATALGRAAGHVARGVAEGAGAGGLTAAVRQEGDLGESALTGALLGGGLGAGVAGSYGLGRAVRALKNQVRPSQTWAEQNARQLLSNSIGPDARLLELEQALAQGNSRPLTIADLGRENVRSRAEAAYKQPGEGRDDVAQLLTERMAEQPHRVAADLSLTLTPQINRGAALTIDSLDQLKRRLARPLYDEAYAYGRVATSELEPIIKRLEASGAMEAARKLAAIEGRDFTGFDRVGTGSKAIPAIDMRDVDIIQRGIRQAEEAALGANGRPTTQSLAFQRLRESRDPNNPGFLDIIDSFNPKFKEARRVWAEGSGNTEAIELGRKLLSHGNEPRFEQTMREFKRLRPGEQDYFRLGLAQDIVDRMGKVSETADAAKTILSPRMVNRMRQAFDRPQDFDTFIKGLQQEALMGRTAQRIMGGSRTQQLAAEQGGMNTESLVHLGTALARGDYHALTRSIFATLAKHLNSPTMDRKTASELQRILFNPSQADNQRILDEIKQLRAGQRPGATGPSGQPVPLPDAVVDLSRAIATQPMLQVNEGDR